MESLIDLYQREDPTWELGELRVLLGIPPPQPPSLAQRQVSLDDPTADPSAYRIKTQAMLCGQDQSRTYSFESSAAAQEMEAQLSDFDTQRLPPDYKRLRVYGKDRGLDP